MATEYRLTYFNSRGRAELTRVLFKLAEQEFTDRRFESTLQGSKLQTDEEWAKIKPITPKGLLPVLEVDGKMICESLAIARFVAREFNLYGANNWENAVCDMIVDSLQGVFQNMMGFFMAAKTEEEKIEAMKKLLDFIETMDKHVASLKKGKFVLGDKPSLADAAVHNVMELTTKIPDFDPAKYSTLNEVSESFAAVPAIAEWIKSRPESEY